MAGTPYLSLPLLLPTPISSASTSTSPYSPSKSQNIAMNRVVLAARPSAGRIYPQVRCSSLQSDTNPAEHHIGKQLSRPSKRVLESHKEWAAIAKRFPKRNWRDVEPIGLNAWSAAKYEHTGLAKIHKRSYDANVLVEIRDVRVPASSHHPSFTRLAKHRTHLIAYTHADLIDEETRDKVEDWTNTIWPESQTIFVDTRADSRTVPRATSDPSHPPCRRG